MSVNASSAIFGTCCSDMSSGSRSPFALQTTGRLLSRLTNDVALVQRPFPRRWAIWRESLALVGFAGLLFYYDPRLALVCLTGAPLVVYPLVRLGQRVRRTARRSQEALEQMSHVSAEAITGHRIVKAFGAAEGEATKFERASQHFYRTSMKVTSSLSALPPPMEFIGGGVCWRPRVWLAGNRRWPVVARGIHRLRGRAVHDVRASQEAQSRERRSSASDGGG